MTKRILPTRKTISEDLPTRSRRRRVRIANGKSKLRSHVVWHDHTGHWPELPEVIHHIDGDHTNDEFSNLVLMSHAEHTSIHSTGRSHSEETRAKMSADRQSGGCFVDKMVGRWGPYRYYVTKHKGKQTWRYLGKTSRFLNVDREEDRSCQKQ